MPDIIAALLSQCSALERRKAQIQSDANRQIKEIDEEIQNVKNALDTIKKAVSGILCPDCGGTGTKRQADAAGQMEDVPCAFCHGTGIKP